MLYRYGNFTRNQISEVKAFIRKRIFFLLLIVENTEHKYDDVDVNKAFNNELTRIGGFNSLLGNPMELVNTMMLLEAARLEYNSPEFSWSEYRKLVLDAGNEIKKIEEV